MFIDPLEDIEDNYILFLKVYSSSNGLQSKIKEFINISLTMNAWTLVIHIVASLIIIMFISYFVWKPTSKFIEKNKEKLDKEHKDLILYNRETKHYLNVLKEEKKKLANIRKHEMDEVNRKVEKIMFDSKREAEEKAKAIQEEAQMRIRALEEKAKEDIKSSVVRLSIELTEKLVNSNINDENSKKIIDTYIDDLEKSSLSSQKIN